MCAPWCLWVVAWTVSAGVDGGVAEVHAQIEAGLEEIAALRRRGDLAAADERAVELKALAERSLKPSDPAWWRPALALNDIRFEAALGRNDLQRAEDLALGASAIVEGGACTLPEGDPARVRVAINRAVILISRNRRDEGLVASERAADLAELDPEANLDSLIDARTLIALLRLDAGREGERAAARLLALVSRRLPGDALKALEAQLFINLHVWQPMHDRAALAVKGGEGSDAAADRLRQDLGRFRDALKAEGADPGWIGWGDDVLLAFQWTHHRLDDIEATLERLGPVVEAAGDDPPRLFAMNHRIALGQVEMERGDLASAREDLEGAVGLIPIGLFPRERGLALGQLGLLLLRQGDYDAARDRLRDAKQLIDDEGTNVPPSHPERLRILINLAKTYEWNGDLDLAELLLEQVAESLGEADPYTRCLYQNNLAMLRYASGAFDQSRADLNEARSIAELEFGGESDRVAEIDVNLGRLAFEEGNLDEAEGRFRSALGVVERRFGPSYHRFAEILGDLGRTLSMAGRTDEARATMERAVDLRLEDMSRMLRSTLSERDRLAYIQALRSHPESRAWPGAFDTYLDLAGDLGIPTERQYARVLAWKGAVDGHATPGAEDLEDDPEVRELAERREGRLRVLRARSRQEATEAGGREREQQLAELAEEVQELERALRARSRRFEEASADDDRPPAPDDVRSAMPPRTALVDVIEVLRYRGREAGEPSVDARRYVGYVVRPGRPIERVDLGDASALDRAATAFLRDLESGGPTAESGLEVAGLVRDPLLPLLDNVDLVIVASDGLLQQVPLAALPGAEPGTYWVEQHAFASIPTARTLVRDLGRNDKANASGALLVGGLDYGGLSSRYPTLEATVGEVESIARTIRRVAPEVPLTIATGSSPSESSIRRLLPKHRIVHLATHGFFRRHASDVGRFDPSDVRDRLDSGLVFAPPSGDAASIEGGDPDDDQILTAEEIGGLDLGGVDLLVLSACSSGLGHIRAGQGLVGLIGSIDRAGGGAVVCSLWEVDDEPTAALMTAFYRHLWDAQGLPDPSRALRAAQLELAMSPESSKAGVPFAHPRSWAAFVLSGDPFASTRRRLEPPAGDGSGE